MTAIIEILKEKSITGIWLYLKYTGLLNDALEGYYKPRQKHSSVIFFIVI